MKYTIRELKESDIPEAARLLKSMWMEHVAKEPELLDYGYIDKVDVKKYLQKYLDKPGAQGFVAIVDGKIAGLATVETQKFNDMHSFKKLAYFDNLVVHPDYRRHGLASSLIDTRIAWAKTNKIKVCQAKIYTYNESAQRLVTKHGFKETYRHYYNFLSD